jgi:hypothetical protein
MRGDVVAGGGLRMLWVLPLFVLLLAAVPALGGYTVYSAFQSPAHVRGMSKILTLRILPHRPAAGHYCGH